MTTHSWPSFLTFQGNADGIFRALTVLLASIVIIYYSSLFEEEYNQKLIKLYICPWWRFLIVFLLISSAIWCPRVGILIALVVFFYLNDMNTLITPLPNL
jgi:hypothetical protein